MIIEIQGKITSLTYKYTFQKYCMDIWENIYFSCKYYTVNTPWNF